MTIFISNQPHQVTEAELFELFDAYGPVECVVLPRDFETNQVWGFSFVDMTEIADEAAAIAQLNGSKWMAHCLQVSEAGFTSWDSDFNCADLEFAIS